eukprot:SAG11_NODE_1833_length_4189_cov_20.714914_3_plen_23_part_01
MLIIVVGFYFFLNLLILVFPIGT